MDKLLLWIRKPLGIGLISLTSVVLVMYANYHHKTKKLAELEYREEVRVKQQEVVDKYGETEKEIKDRHHKFVIDKEAIAIKVRKEIDDAKDSNSSSYHFTASDRNSTF